MDNVPFFYRFFYTRASLSAKTLVDGLLGVGLVDGEPEPARPLLDKGEDTCAESLVGVKMASLKVYLHNKSFLSNLIAEQGETREIARMSSLDLPHAGSWLSVVPSPALGLHLRAAEFIPVVKYRLGIPIYSKEGPCALSDCMGDQPVTTSLAAKNMATGYYQDTVRVSG